MLIPSKNAQDRIKQLIDLDQQTDQQLDEQYKQCMAYISAHVTAFFNQYAIDNNLTLQEANQAVSKWDLRQFQSALEMYDTSSYPDDLKARITGYAGFVHVSRKHALMASIAMLMIGLAYSNQQTIVNRIIDDGNKQLQRLNKYTKVDIPDTLGGSFTTEDDNVKIWSQNIWTKTDELTHDVEKTVNLRLRHGMKLADLQDMLNEHANPKQFKPNQSIADRVKQMEFNNRRITRTESARLINKVNVATYRQAGVRMVRVELQPGACPLCQEMEDGGPYRLNDAPYIPRHPNCRCILVAVGSVYEQFVTRLETMLNR